MNDRGKRFEIILILLIILIFIVMQPKLSVVIFPQKRNILLSNYLDNIKTNKQIISREFWKFREFYYPGYFKLDKNGFEPSTFSFFLDELGVKFITDSKPLVFLLYKSDKINSIEALIDKDSLDQIVVIKHSGLTNVIINSKNEFVDKSGDNIRVLFIKPVSDMVLTNGYFDHKNPRDRTIFENKYWLSASMIKIN